MSSTPSEIARLRTSAQRGQEFANTIGSRERSLFWGGYLKALDDVEAAQPPLSDASKPNRPSLTQSVAKLFSPIGSRKVGVANQQGIVFVEHLPRRVTDVEGEALGQAAQVGGPVNNARGYESLDDAIAHAKDIGARLLGYVEPENLLFFFGQLQQPIAATLLASSNDIPLSDPTVHGAPHGDEPHCATEQQAKPNNRAMVFCEVCKPDAIERLFREKEQQRRDHPDWCEITWDELVRVAEAGERFHGESVGSTSRGSTP